MGIAIALSARNPTAARIEALWDSAAAFEDTPSMRSLDYRPHLTLAIYRGSAPTMARAQAALNRAVEAEDAIALTFERLRLFKNEPWVLWAGPRSHAGLDRIFAAIHAVLPPELCDPHYRPRAWIPHCTLAMRIAHDRREEAQGFADGFREEIVVVFDSADCISFPPVRIIDARPLQAR